MNVLITGANGFLGRHVVARADRQRLIVSLQALHDEVERLRA